MGFMSKETANVAPRGGEYIVEARGLTKIYDTGKVRVEALKGVDLGVRRGEMVAIMGPSGCGKTTFLNCVTGLDAYTAGDVLIEGVSLTKMSDNRRTEYRARRMGFVFQSYNLLPVLSAAENVELPLLVSGVAPRQARARALRALDLVGLPDKAHSRPAELSGGQRQRVTIARALVNDPAIVFADEPTGALDSESAGAIMDLLVRLNKAQGQTVVMVTHDPGVGARADRIVRFRDGAIVGEEAAAGGRDADVDDRLLEAVGV
ncbi:MAG TPA: ABC transporter ATP-binding protein [Thermomicrobiales bacterium]|nr:ABC transporter ATP-binding protein [Thermomicrobiales bacterium]